MYTYIYSSYLQKRKYQRQLSDIETELGAFGIGGDIRRLSNFLTLESISRDVLKKKNATAIVVGDDATFFQVMNLLAGSKVVLGLIPMGESFYGEILGLDPESAAEITAARLIEQVDLGRIDKKYFLKSAYSVKDIQLSLKCDDFLIETKKKFRLCISNIEPGNPYDGKLEAIVFSRSLFSKTERIFANVPLETCSLSNNGSLEMALDYGQKFILPFKARVAPKAVRLIVGKGRAF